MIRLPLSIFARPIFAAARPSGMDSAYVPSVLRRLALQIGLTADVRRNGNSEDSASRSCARGCVL
jgi:hypothetical protein